LYLYQSEYIVHPERIWKQVCVSTDSYLWNSSLQLSCVNGFNRPWGMHAGDNVKFCTSKALGAAWNIR